MSKTKVAAYTCPALSICCCDESASHALAFAPIYRTAVCATPKNLPAAGEICSIALNRNHLLKNRKTRPPPRSTKQHATTGPDNLEAGSPYFKYLTWLSHFRAAHLLLFPIPIDNGKFRQIDKWRPPKQSIHAQYTNAISNTVHHFDFDSSSTSQKNEGTIFNRAIT